MKKRILGLLLGLSLVMGALSGCGSENADTPRNEEEVGEGTGTQTENSDEENPTGETLSYLAKETIRDDYGSVTEYEYDEQGNLIRTTVSNGNEYYNDRQEYEYDTMGNLLREKTSYISEYSDSYSEQTHETEHEYDAAGNLLRSKSTETDVNDYTYEDYINGGMQEVHSVKTKTTEDEYEYDAAGKILRTVSNYVETYEDNQEDEDRVFISADEVSGQGTIEVLYEYDAAGNLIKETNTDSYESEVDAFSFTFISWTIYEYDAAGNLLKESHYYDWNPDSPDEWTEYEYDQAGNLIQKSDENRTYKYEYDAAGNLIMETYYNNGTEWERREYEYNEDGKQIKLNWYYWDDGTGKVMLMSEREYDAAGNEVVYRAYHDSPSAWNREVPVGSLAYWGEYTYDEEGNRISTIIYNADGSIDSQYETTYSVKEEFDEAGRVIKRTNYENDVMLYWTEYEYR